MLVETALDNDDVMNEPVLSEAVNGTVSSDDNEDMLKL